MSTESDEQRETKTQISDERQPLVYHEFEHVAEENASPLHWD